MVGVKPHLLLDVLNALHRRVRHNAFRSQGSRWVSNVNWRLLARLSASSQTAEGAQKGICQRFQASAAVWLRPSYFWNVNAAWHPRTRIRISLMMFAYVSPGSKFPFDLFTLIVMSVVAFFLEFPREQGHPHWELCVKQRYACGTAGSSFGSAC